ncbi:hypothetical protein ACFPRL_09295 [Pseudoclavibacter helvolus]
MWQNAVARIRDRTLAQLCALGAGGGMRRRAAASGGERRRAAASGGCGGCGAYTGSSTESV